MLQKDSIISTAMIQTIEIGSNHNQKKKKKIVILCKSLSSKPKSEDVNSGPGGHEIFALKAVEFDGLGGGSWKCVCKCVCVCGCVCVRAHVCLQ